MSASSSLRGELLKCMIFAPLLKVAEAGGFSNQGLAGRTLQALLLMEHTRQDDGLVRLMCDRMNATKIIMQLM